MYQFILSPIGTYAKTQIAAICSPSTGILEYSENNGFIIYPNPTSHSFTILSKDNIENVTIYDYSGKLVFESSNQNISTINLPTSLSNGIYFIRLKANNQIKTAKIIIDN